MTAKNSKQKGSEFEKEFAEFMKKKLGYKDCYLNQKVKGKISTNEYEVDIIGKRLSEKGENMKDLGFWAVFIGGILLLAGLFDLIKISQDILIVIGVLIIGGGIALQIAKENEFEYSWIECKDHKTKIGKDVVNTLKDKVIDYHKSEDKKFTFNKTILVSASGIIPNALRFAKEHSIECYCKSGNNEFVKYDLNSIIE